MSGKSEELACKFTARIEERDGNYVVEVPESEIEFGTLSSGDVCRISVQRARESNGQQTLSFDEERDPQPPVSQGERRTVEIEDIGEQGDGIARVDRGYVLIVPDSEVGDEVTVEIQGTNPNYGFAEVVDE